ncbi:MAG: glycosyltransferase [Vicinamibacterales bacterium]
MSVIVPTLDSGRTVIQALESVVAQTWRDFEIIVVDAGSADDTAARVERFGHAVVFRCLEPATRAQLLNEAISLARGSTVAFLDPADLWMPRKLERQMRYLASHVDAGLVYGDVTPSPRPMRRLLESSDALPVGAAETAPAPVGTLDPIVVQPVLSTLLVRRTLLDVDGPFREVDDRDSTEQDLWRRLARRTAAGHLALPLAIVRTLDRGIADAPPGQQRARNLLHDTTFRRLRSAGVVAFHRVDDSLWRRRRTRMRILFEAASPMSLAVFDPVYRQLVQDPRLEFWFTSCDQSWDARAIFAAAGITERVMPADRLRWEKFDAYLNTDFWDMTWLPRRTRRVHLFHGVAGKYGLDAPVRIAPVVATFDRLMFPNRDRLRRYAEAGLVDGDSPQAALIGYPKVDCLVDGSLDRKAILNRLGLRADLPTVLYAPTWSPYSSLNVMGRDVIAALGRLGVNLVVKLHDRSYDATTRGSGGVDWRRAIEELCREHGAHLAREADASPYLFAADALVTDHSSVGFEFMLLDRPIVVIHSPELIARARVTPQKVVQLQSAAFVAQRARDVAPLVRSAFEAPAHHSTARRGIADELFYCPGSATARAVACLYELLNLPAPDTTLVPRRAQGGSICAPVPLHIS